MFAAETLVRSLTSVQFIQVDKLGRSSGSLLSGMQTNSPTWVVFV